MALTPNLVFHIQLAQMQPSTKAPLQVDNPEIGPVHQVHKADAGTMTLVAMVSSIQRLLSPRCRTIEMRLLPGLD